MAELIYTLSTPEDVGTTGLSSQDSVYSNTVVLNSEFNVETDYVEINAYTLGNSYLGRFEGTSQVKQTLSSNSAGKQGTSIIYIDPLAFSQQTFPDTPTQLHYHFLRRVESTSAFISEISPDRLEIRLKAFAPNSLQDLYNSLETKLTEELYFPKLLLELSPLEKILILNVDQRGSDIILKLYSPLSLQFEERSAVRILEEIADTVVYSIDVATVPTLEKLPTLKGPNFDIELEDQSDISTEYLDYNELLSYPVTGSYNKIFAQLSGSGVNLNVDYTAFENFVHFSSAEERLVNFKYKLDLIHSYEAAKTANSVLTGATAAVQTSNTKYDKLIKGVISNFDGYERYLYFESGSTSWPKSTSTPPYINELSTSATATSWFTTSLASASLYDELNESRLTYTLPEFIRQDQANAPADLFLDMIGQHFDNLWVYAKGITDKYDADNRLDYGISKDLIVKTLQNFGVKLYSSNFSTANLSKLMLGEWYDSGSESITTFVTASNLPTPDQNILHETYKRIYHNLPYLVKTKGTERGLRALINCFGIPSGSLRVREFGGLTTELDFSPGYSYPAQTDEKIRLYNTGSAVPGSTLSNFTSIIKPENIYSQDQHAVEVGFSPSYYVDEYITNYTLPPDYVEGYNLADLGSAPNYRIDNYIGDPRHTSRRTYIELNKLRDLLLTNLSKYNVYDFIRLVKFFDNQLFKMIKDFTPARSTVSTGIIIKPHILNRSKTGQVLPTATRPEYSASIDTAFIEGSEPGLIDEYSVAFSQSIDTPLGSIARIFDTEKEKIDGELGGSRLTVTTGELNDENPFKHINQPPASYTLTEYLDGDGITENNYLYGYPISSGNMSMFWGTAFSGGNFVKHIKIHFDSATAGMNFETSFRSGITAIQVGNIVYTPSSIKLGTGAAVLSFDEGKTTAFSLNPGFYPKTSTVNVIVIPYALERFDNSDYNALFNNASSIANSARLQKVDYTAGSIVASNIEAIRQNTADIADVQEYLHNSIGMVSGRYKGKQLRGAEINVFDASTDVSYGIKPVIEQTVPYFGTFSQLYATPDIYNAVEVTVPYVTFEDGDLYQTGANKNTQNDMKFIFTQNKYASLLVKTSPAGPTNFTGINKDYRIKRGGKRLETVLNTQSGSLNASGKLISEPLNSFQYLFFGDDTGVAEYRLNGLFSGSDDRADEMLQGSTVLIEHQTKTPAGSLASYDATNKAYQVSAKTGTPIRYVSELLFEFDRIGTGWGNDISLDVILERYDGSNWSTVQTRTVVPSWNRYESNFSWDQPEGIEIVGYYKTSTGVQKVFVKVTLDSGGIAGFLSSDKLRTKVVNNSSNENIYLLNYIKGFYNSVNSKYTIEFRNTSRTADLPGGIKVVFGPNYTSFPFDLRTKLEVTQDTLPQKVVSFDIDPLGTGPGVAGSYQAYPPFAPGIQHPTGSISLGTTITAGGSSSPYLWVSSSLGEVIGQIQNSDQVQTLGFRPINTPLSFQIGDEIRLAGREETVHTIVDIWTKSDSRLNADSLLNNRGDKTLVLQIDPPIPFGVNNFNVLIRRYVDDPTKVLLYDDKPRSLDEIGLITPRYITEKLEQNYEDYSYQAFTQIQ